MSLMAPQVIVPTLHTLAGGQSLTLDFLSRVTLNGSRYQTLQDLLKQNKNLKVTVYDFSLGHTQGHLLMCHSHIDAVLCDLAQDCAMPRGFPIIYIPGTHRQEELFLVGGFFPKFKNDTGCQDTLVRDTSLSGSLKYSGFLGGILPFRYAGENYVIYTSKNATNSSYSQDLRRIMEENYQMAKVLEHCCEAKQFFYVECLSKNDMTHGYAIKREVGLVTCMGLYRDIVASPGVVVESTAENFVTYLSMAETQEHCRRLGLAVDMYFTADRAGSLMKGLNEERDLMTYSRFYEILTDARHQVTVYPGTAKHEDFVQGDVLEGIVLHLETETVKYKFVKYVIRTMLYRPFLVDGSWHPERFLQSWCNTELGRSYWRCRAKAWRELVDRDSQELTGETGVAQHIRVADQVDQLGEEELASYQRVPERHVHIVLVLGPIGCGKSTVGRLLAEQNPLLHHIDGDAPGLVTVREVLRLGSERNPYTLWQVIKTLLEGRVPVISTGGGAVSDLTEVIRQFLDCDVKYTIYLPTLSDDTEPISVSYQERALTRQVVMERLAGGVWNLPAGKAQKEFVETIVSRSMKNETFAHHFLQASSGASQVVRFPYLTRETYDSLTITSPDVSQPERHASFRAQQTRLLAFITRANGDTNHVGHVTLRFAARREIHLYVGGPSQARTIPGVVLSLVDATGHSSQCIKVALPHPDHCEGLPQYAHVTVNPGRHRPDRMRAVAIMHASELDQVTIDDLTYTVKEAEFVHIELRDVFYL